MNEAIKIVFEDKIARWGIILAGLILLLEVLSIIVFYFSLPPLLPLFNQLPWGEGRLGIRPGIFLPFILVTIFVLMNFFVSSNIYTKNPLLARILGITSLLISLLSFIFVIRTIYLLI